MKRASDVITTDLILEVTMSAAALPVSGVDRKVIWPETAPMRIQGTDVVTIEDVVIDQVMEAIGVTTKDQALAMITVAAPHASSVDKRAIKQENVPMRILGTDVVTIGLAMDVATIDQVMEATDVTTIDPVSVETMTVAAPLASDVVKKAI